MNWLNRLFGRETGALPVDINEIHSATADVFDGRTWDEQPKSVIAIPNRPVLDKFVLQTFALRKGMWVHSIQEMSDPLGYVGILTGCSADAIAEVTVTKPDGSNVMTLNEHDHAVPLVVFVHVSTLRQAYIDEIPLPRRPRLDVLRSLGYQTKSEVSQ